MLGLSSSSSQKPTINFTTILAPIGEGNGEGGIRTHGTFRINGFQDRRLQPLGHLSMILTDMYLSKNFFTRQVIQPQIQRGIKKAPLTDALTFIKLFFFAELALVCAAHRANPIFRKISKSCTRFNTTISIPCSRVVNITAKIAYIFVHLKISSLFVSDFPRSSILGVCFYYTHISAGLTSFTSPHAEFLHPIA